MHELALAEAILDLACERAGTGRVTRVGVRVGHLRQVVRPALEFGFEVAAQGTAAEGAELVVEEVPAAGLCRGCGAETPLPGFPLCCQGCGSLDVEVVRGEELRVEWLELEEGGAEGGGA